VSISDFRKWVPDADLDDLKRCFRGYPLAGSAPENTYYVDGGVLDNKPFGWAIDAIKQRRADVEVERRLLYLEPDPGERFAPEKGRPVAPKAAPGTLAAIMAAVSGLPRHEPILDDLLDVRSHNARVQRLRDVIETSFTGVAEIVGSVVGSLDDIPDDAQSAKLAEWTTEVNKRAIAEAGLAYATYLRVKISGTVDRYAESVCNVCDFPDDSNHAQLARSVLRSWAVERGLFSQQPEPTELQLTFLRHFDLGYQERRLRFVTSALRWWYRDLADGKSNIPPREDLDRGKQILYDAVTTLRRTMGGDDFEESLRKRIRVCFDDNEIMLFLQDTGLEPDLFLERQKAQIEEAEQELHTFLGKRLDGFSAKLYRDLYALSGDWHPDRRRDLLVRYLGFPLWDVLLYPIQAFADAGENDTLRVQRMSPYEARVLSTPPGEKVKGKRLMHFWAFFDRVARENDYLWGRLDGAAHLIGILLGKDHPEYRSWCLRAFSAILEEDEAALSHVSDTVKDLRAELARG
jgi:patatin-related protein